MLNRVYSNVTITVDNPCTVTPFMTIHSFYKLEKLLQQVFWTDGVNGGFP